MNQAQDTVQAFLKAMNADDYKTARTYANPDLQFVGVMGARNGAESYFADMEKMRFHYDIKRVFADGDDVCVWYDINMGEATILCAGWYHVTEGKINSIRVIFDPRPLLEKDK